MSKTQAQAQPTLSASTLHKPGAGSTLGRDSVVSAIDALTGPVTYVLTLWVLGYRYEDGVWPSTLILSTLVFAMAFPSQSRLEPESPFEMIFDIAFNWFSIAALLLITGYATGYIHEYSRHLVKHWLWLAPLCELLAYLLLRAAAPLLLSMQGPPQRAIVVGMNEQGMMLANKLQQQRYTRVELAGFVDSRTGNRLSKTTNVPLIGGIGDLAELAKSQRIQIIYLSLPMASQPRILHILDQLKDTTASIYFVPDMFVTDLIQGHTTSVCGLPVISVCETPFTGTDGMVKRLSDIVLSSLILLLVSPILLTIAILIKAGSPGPVIFKQRRYGLDGEEILVYKFRSMTVTEDGGTVTQAQKNDKRVTPLGAILRRTSLDELPQFVNVLQGRMSIVGPRPHAVAHNEMYRKLIKGYMVRHKVKPGITGWAQVNGYRGETETLDKMQGRIDHDLDYLRNWSLKLDLHIIFKTIRLVLLDRSAY
jgi:putative colanic acid biosynthesis UDP-glucose lipid carrier transferase